MGPELTCKGKGHRRVGLLSAYMIDLPRHKAICSGAVIWGLEGDLLLVRLSDVIRSAALYSLLIL